VCCWLCFCFLIGTGVKCSCVLYLYTQIGCSGLNREDLSKVPSSFQFLLRMDLQNQSSAGSNDGLNTLATFSTSGYVYPTSEKGQRAAVCTRICVRITEYAVGYAFASNLDSRKVQVCA